MTVVWAGYREQTVLFADEIACAVAFSKEKDAEQRWLCACGPGSFPKGMNAEIRAVLRLRTMQQKRVWESGRDYRVEPGNDRFGGGLLAGRKKLIERWLRG